MIQKLVLIAIFLCAITAFSAETAIPVPDVVSQLPGGLLLGDTIPLLATLDVEGKSWDAQYIISGGRYLVISFFTTYCPPCIKEFPGFLKMKKELGDSLEVVLVSVGFDDRDILKRFRVDKNLTPLAMLRDKYSAIRKPFGVTDKVPVTFLISPKGMVLYSQFGAFPDEQPYDVLMPIIKRKR